ncbi:hypothetical protein A3K70_02940 [Candidatus Bathyarchaeota archaeon RBG_16_48_13]|nr:MAG: hypothetical protein A3K70_02940 [Candidatus Bathyarchaeota archaeon RBG_16_48_13]
MHIEAEIGDWCTEIPRLVVGEVVATHVDEEILDQESKIDLAKAQMLVYSGWAWKYWDLGKN